MLLRRLDALAGSIDGGFGAPRGRGASRSGTSQFGADSFLDHPLTALGAEILVQPSDTGVVVSLALNSQRPIHSQAPVPEGMRLIP